MERRSEKPGFLSKVFRFIGDHVGFSGSFVAEVETTERYAQVLRNRDGSIKSAKVLVREKIERVEIEFTNEDNAHPLSKKLEIDR